MANFLRYGGLRFINSFHGGASIGQKMTKDSAGATAIFRGDVVAREADVGLAPGGTPGTTLYDGVAQDYGAALTQTDHLVIVDPNACFEAQSGATGLAAADEGLNANFIFSAGDAARLLSGHLINDGTEAVTGTLDCHLRQFLRASDNDEGAYSRFIVTINRHRLSPLSAGV